MFFCSFPVHGRLVRNANNEVYRCSDLTFPDGAPLSQSLCHQLTLWVLELEESISNRNSHYETDSSQLGYAEKDGAAIAAVLLGAWRDAR